MEEGAEKSTSESEQGFLTPAEFFSSDFDDKLNLTEEELKYPAASRLHAIYEGVQTLQSTATVNGGTVGADVMVPGEVAPRELDHVSDEGLVSELFRAVRHGHKAKVENCLQLGVGVDARDSYGNSILIVACQNGNKRLAKLALRQGADINLQNFKGNTPLHYCYAFNYVDLGNYLISKGADPDDKSKTEAKSPTKPTKSPTKPTKSPTKLTKPPLTPTSPQ